MGTSEVNIPSFKQRSWYDGLQGPSPLQFASVVPAALGALPAEASDILLPVVPVKTSTHLIQRFLFSKVSSYYTSMA